MDFLDIIKQNEGRYLHIVKTAKKTAVKDGGIYKRYLCKPCQDNQDYIIVFDYNKKSKFHKINAKNLNILSLVYKLDMVLIEAECREYLYSLLIRNYMDCMDG